MIPPSEDKPASLSRRLFLGLLAAAGAGLASARSATAAEARADEVVTQRDDTGACGPCALANALLHGDERTRRAFRALPGANPQERVEALIARYGTKPSETYGPRRARFVAGAGITNGDMPFLANDFLGASGLPAVGGEWLDQQTGEDGPGQLRRLHRTLRGALAGGLPPICEVRAFSADPSTAKPSFVNLYAHWMALVGVYPAELPSRATGFYCQFADSVTGRVIPAFAYAETVRPFMATRGFSLRADGGKDWHWLSGQPYILVNLPDLPLAIQTRPWHERTLVALTYLLRRGAGGKPVA